MAVEAAVDYVALSFVRKSQDLDALRRLVPRSIKLIAKIDAAHIAALDDGKHGDCARLLKLRAEVQGLVGPRNVAIAVRSAEALTEEEIRDRAAAILRRARERVAGGVGSPDGG